MLNFLKNTFRALIALFNLKSINLDDRNKYSIEYLYSLLNEKGEDRIKFYKHMPTRHKLIQILGGILLLGSILATLSSSYYYINADEKTVQGIISPAIFIFMANFSFRGIKYSEDSYKDYIKIKIDERKYIEDKNSKIKNRPNKRNRRSKRI